MPSWEHTLEQAATTAISLALAAVLIVSGLGKIARLERFRRALTSTYGWPTSAAAIAARLVPLVELACAGLLVWPAARTLGLLLTSGLLLTMAAMTGVAWAKGSTGDCGCWGIVQEQLGPRTVARDIFLAFLSVVALAVRLG